MQHQMTTVDVSDEPSTITFLQVVNAHLAQQASESWELISATVGKYEEAGWTVLMFWKRPDLEI
jgi:hypothetical protein